jgi:hypothetical protein
LDKYLSIIFPIVVLRSGNRHSSAGRPRCFKYSTNLVHWVLFPDLSSPSNTINAPRLFSGMVLSVLDTGKNTLHISAGFVSCREYRKWKRVHFSYVFHV